VDLVEVLEEGVLEELQVDVKEDGHVDFLAGIGPLLLEVKALNLVEFTNRPPKGVTTKRIKLLLLLNNSKGNQHFKSFCFIDRMYFDISECSAHGFLPSMVDGQLEPRF